MRTSYVSGRIERSPLTVLVACVGRLFGTRKTTIEKVPGFDPSEAPDWQLRDLGFKDGRATNASLRREARLR